MNNKHNLPAKTNTDFNITNVDGKKGTIPAIIPELLKTAVKELMKHGFIISVKGGKFEFKLESTR